MACIEYEDPLLHTLAILLVMFQVSYAHKVPPTSFGAHYSGSLATGQTVLFTGSGSHDNDEQDDLAETPYWMWDFQYDGTTFNDLSTTYEGQLAQWTYSQAGPYTVAVIYVDDDGQAGNVYTFQVTIAPSLKRYYYVKDHLGSIRVTVNEAGGVVSWDDYDPWGMQLEGRSGTTVAENRYKFTEKERDVETGYDYFGARYYDSRIARWMSVDPKSSKGPWITPYGYALNNPLANVDPDGQWPFKVNWGGVASSTLNLVGYSIQTVTACAASVVTVGNPVALGFVAHGSGGYATSVANLSLSLQGKEPTFGNIGEKAGQLLAGKPGQHIGATVDNAIAVLQPAGSISSIAAGTIETAKSGGQTVKAIAKQVTNTIDAMQTSGNVEKAGFEIQKTAAYIGANVGTLMNTSSQAASTIQAAQSATSAVKELSREDDK